MTLSHSLRDRLPGLPVATVLEQLQESLSSPAELCALTAPPGSGKTLLAPTWLWERMGFNRVFVLVPRRVNARLPVLFLQDTLGPKVGYRIRFEKRWDEAQTRIGYLTYGTALRTFAEDPPGSDDLVIFDEFHERPWEADLLLAYLRRDKGPCLLLMSATLDQANLPSETPVVESDGRLFPVELSWETTEPMLLARPEGLASLVRQRSGELFRVDPGEQLIFLPGMAAIREVENALRADPLGGEIDILHSSLPENEIRRVVERPSERGFRRILSTDLAESSVTLPGVTVVLDSGLKRHPRRDAFGLGITLETTRTPLASLIQRAGRAGRTSHGRCHRLLTRQDELSREPFVRPEISQVDGKTLALHLASLGLLERWKELSWLSPPPASSVEEAVDWLKSFDLLSGDRLSARGQRVLSSTCSPRAGLFGCLAREEGWPTEKVVDWTSAFDGDSKPNSGALPLADRLADKAWKASRESRLLERLRQVYSFAPNKNSPDAAPLCRAFSDTVVALRGDRAVPAFGKAEALWFRPSHPPDTPYALLLGTVPAGGGGPNSAVSLYHPLSTDEVWEAFLEQMEETIERAWERKSRSVRETRRTVLGQLVLEEESRGAAPGPETAQILRENLRLEELGDDFAHLSRRLRLFFPTRPEVAQELLHRLGVEASDIPTALLTDYLQTLTRWGKNSPEELVDHARGLLGYGLLRELEQALPSSVQLPGRRHRTSIVYPDQGSPYVASKLQDFFGWTPPRLLGGTLKLACHLLAPSGRPVQITEDLEGFWRGSYAQVRKDLRGRYPKHDWPENPP